MGNFIYWILGRVFVIKYIFNSYFDTHDFLYRNKFKLFIHEIRMVLGLVA